MQNIYFRKIRLMQNVTNLYNFDNFSTDFIKIAKLAIICHEQNNVIMHYK